MTLAEYCKLKRDNEHLSEEDFALLAWKKQRENIKEVIRKQELERKQKELEKKVEETVEKEIDKNLDKVVEKALLSGKSSLDIKINL